MRLPYSDWQKTAAAHRAKAEKWTCPYRARRAERRSHPIWDFLFTYYSFPPSLLENWHPGPGVVLEVPEDSPYPAPPFPAKAYRREGNDLFLDPGLAPEKVRQRWRQTLALLQATASRPPQFGCFGLHEWAMVYQGGQENWIRHAEVLPLRLPSGAIDRFVESQSLCCSHFDAFRFFSPNARPLNRTQPRADQRLAQEQPGCLHANMDLYKWAAHAMPWAGADLLLDCFLLATETRQLDMEASPYDVRPLGFVPVPIETPEGRVLYAQRQKALADKAAPLRARLIDRFQELLQLAESHSPTQSVPGIQ